MHPIEAYFIQALEANRTPDITYIGGLHAIHDQRCAIANSPVLDEILRSVIQESDLTDEDHKDWINALFSEAFLRSTEPIVVREIIRLLAANVDLLKQCFPVLLKLAADKERPGILRRYYLAGAFEIALYDSAKKYSLIGYLLDIDNNEDPTYLTHLIKIIGLGFTFFDQDDLFNKLESFEDSNEPELFFELAMGWLHKGLNASVADESTRCFSQAQKYFSIAEKANCEEARKYCLLLRILDEFSTSKETSEIHHLIQALQNNIKTNAAWNLADTSLSWTRLRHTELMNWNLLTEKLGRLISDLDEPSWFEPTMVIEDYLLTIYSSSRSILNRDSAHGIDQIIQPVIRDRMADQRTQVYLLEQWLNRKTDHHLWAVAEQLRTEIANYKAGRTTGNEQGTTAITAVVPAYSEIPKEEQSNFQAFIANYKAAQTVYTSKVISSVFEELCDQLSSVASFNDKAIQFSFQCILYLSLHFLELRMDKTRKNHPEMSYLFKGDNMPMESALQQDYYTFMSAQPLVGKVRVEISDIASGRVDVLFNFLSYQICIEVKRELSDCSFENLSKQYLGQAMQYSNTSAKLGILLVLDLTDKPHGIASFESQVKLEISSTPGDSMRRGVVIIKVPGNRVTPSQVKMPNMP